MASLHVFVLDAGTQFQMSEPDGSLRLIKTGVPVGEIDADPDAIVLIIEQDSVLKLAAWLNEQYAKSASRKNAEVWAIVKEVAQEHSTCYDDNRGRMECPFCNGSENLRQQPDGIIHELDCIVVKARELCENGDS